MRRFLFPLLLAVSAQAQIQVDLAKPVGPYTPIYSWFGYDESNYTTMVHGRELLKELHDLSPVPVNIRAHHLLTSGDGVAELKWSSTNVFRLDAQGKPVYDFTITDGIFDAFKAAGVRPMVELGFMPKDLAAVVPGVTEYQIHFPANTIMGASNNPPRDYAMWGELIRVYTAHLVERYGRDEVAQWYFEVWNEPDISYWHGTEADYFKLYDYSVAAVRAALPGAKVGGPASTGPAGEKASKFLTDFLTHCQNDKNAADGRAIPLDFISFHPKGHPEVVNGHVRMSLAAEMKAAAEGFRIVASFPRYKATPIILSEADPEGCAACSMKMNPANGYRNGTLYPAYTAAALKDLFALQDRYGVNLLAMVSWSFEFEGKDYFEGFRSLATNGVDKPILNLFRMAGMMAGERVKTSSEGEVGLDELLRQGVTGHPDVDAMATRAGRGAEVLVWNYHDDDLPAEGTGTSVTVEHLPVGVGQVRMEHYRVDDSHSNAYTVWKTMGSPQAPTAEQVARLKAAGQLERMGSPVWLEVRDGSVKIPVEMPRQSVSLLQLSW